jgi:hypothetical protein
MDELPPDIIRKIFLPLLPDGCHLLAIGGVRGKLTSLNLVPEQGVLSVPIAI